ncbi:MAG: hypothetical protein JWN99_2112, partial [Ilumatobacteraceae bacterium]|nr:hypothetical protein [Ilumatobacteraceae bacterium]
DAYAPNEYGGDDSVLDLTDETHAVTHEALDPESPGAAIDVVDGEIPEPNEPA